MKGFRPAFKEAHPVLQVSLQSHNIENLHCVVLARVLDDQEEQTIFIDAAHFGDKGNKILSRALAQSAANVLKGGPAPTQSRA